MADEHEAEAAKPPSPVVEAEAVCCAACGGEQNLKSITMKDKTIYLCPFCKDSIDIVKMLARRAGMTLLSRMRKALEGRSTN